MLSRSQTLKSTYTVILFIWHCGQADTDYRDGKQISSYLIAGGEDGATKRHGSIFGSDKTVLYLDFGHGYVCQKSQNFTLKRIGFTVCKSYLNFLSQEGLPREFLLFLQLER